MHRNSPIIARCLFVVAIVVTFACYPSRLIAQATIKDIATNATDPSNLADTEPSIAVNPTNAKDIVVVTFSENWGTNTRAPVWRSADGGSTWQKVRLIPQPSLPGPPPVPTSGPGDQKVAFDAKGNLFVAELGQDGGIHDFVFRQTGTATDPLTAGAAYGDDQPHLDIDRTTGHTCSGRLYSPWLNFGVSPERSTVSNSTNGGSSLTDVGVGDNSAHANRTTRIALASDGKTYIVYKTREGAVSGVHLPGSSNNDFENAHFRVKRSDDCGATWNALGTAGTSVHGSNTVQTFFTSNFGVTGTGRKVARARSSDAWIAVDPSNGDVYVAYVQRDSSNFGQIYVARSTDHGSTWTSHRATDGTHHSAYPEIAVAGNSTVGVLYIDFLDTGSATSFRHRFARSFDNGQTWSDENLQSMDVAGISNASSGFLWGDYEGLTAAGNQFYGVFTGQSISRTTTQLDPIFFIETAAKPTCPKGKTFCGNSCVDLSNDKNNCDTCGLKCGPSHACVSGGCEIKCPAGTQPCCGGDFCRKTCPKQCQ